MNVGYLFKWNVIRKCKSYSILTKRCNLLNSDPLKYVCAVYHLKRYNI